MESCGTLTQPKTSSVLTAISTEAYSNWFPHLFPRPFQVCRLAAPDDAPAPPVVELVPPPLMVPPSPDFVFSLPAAAPPPPLAMAIELPRITAAASAAAPMFYAFIAFTSFEVRYAMP